MVYLFCAHAGYLPVSANVMQTVFACRIHEALTKQATSIRLQKCHNTTSGYQQQRYGELPT